MSPARSQPASMPRRLSHEWVTASSALDPEQKRLFEFWGKSLGISPWLTGLLWSRGMCSLEEMDIFLSPNLRHLASFSSWPGLTEGAETLVEGIVAEKPVAIWGDYDVDGITATAVVKEMLARHGVKATAYIPKRSGEGYGVNVPGIEKLYAQGIRLLLTVDCGISSHEAIRRARDLGMTVIVSDHHLPDEKRLPEAHALVNPCLHDGPCKALAGVGVAFYLMAAANRRLGEWSGVSVDIRQWLDLVALGTLADLVELKGQNRILVKNGLLLLSEGRRPGIAALKEVAGLKGSAALGSTQVVYGLAPRINAAGRLEDADAALELLLSKKYEDACKIAQKLDALNRERRKEEERITEEARKQAQTQADRLGLVLFDRAWNPGIIGIVASRMVEAFQKPVLIFCEENGQYKGSGRSVEAFDLHAALCACSDLFLRFGGHRLAAGMSLLPENMERLRERFDGEIRKLFGDSLPTPVLRFDCSLGFEQAAQFSFLKELELLQPFGPGNQEPTFVSPLVQLKNIRFFGAGGQHALLELHDVASHVSLRAKAWRAAEHFPAAMIGKHLRILYTPRIDSYNGVANVDVRLHDWQWEPSGLVPAQDTLQ